MHHEVSLPDIQTTKLGVNASINNDLVTADIRTHAQKPPLAKNNKQSVLEPAIENSDFVDSDES